MEKEEKLMKTVLLKEVVVHIVKTRFWKINMLSVDDHTKQEGLKFSGNMRHFYMIMCIGKKRYHYITDGEFVAENNPDTIYYSVAGFNKGTDD